MRVKNLLIVLVLAMILPLSLSARLPESRQATFIEMTSATEIMLEATGIYHSTAGGRAANRRYVERHGVQRATDDARRAAVFYVLFSGTDPLISTREEQMRFDARESYFFTMDNINRYITFEDTRILNRVELNDGQGIRLARIVRVDRGAIIRDLESFRIIESRAAIAAAVGFPMIMVIPEVRQGQNPIEMLRNDPIIRHAASVVESHLTQRQFEVIVPQQAEMLQGLTDAQFMIAGGEEDIAYRLALSIGSDVYITFAGLYEDAGFGMRRFAMTVRAFETTTARLLGTETGYSQGRQGEASISVEEAMNAAITNVLSRIMSYWQSDAVHGIQYKLVININPSFSEAEVMDIQDAFMDAVAAISNRYRENIATRQTMDYLIWCDPERFSNSRAVFRALREHFDRTAFGARLGIVNINRKMILLRID